jgi:hypothetical protein
MSNGGSTHSRRRCSAEASASAGFRFNVAFWRRLKPPRYTAIGSGASVKHRVSRTGRAVIFGQMAFSQRVDRIKEGWLLLVVRNAG